MWATGARVTTENDPDIIVLSPAEQGVVEAVRAHLGAAGQALLPGETRICALVTRSTDGELKSDCTGEITFRSLHIAQLWISEAMRGRGLSRRMLETAKAHRLELGCDRAHHETRNPDVLRLYERYAYRSFGEFERYVDDQRFAFENS